MRKLLMAALVGLALSSPAEAGWLVSDPSPSATPVPDMSAIPQPLPITSPAAGPPIDLIGVPYDPTAVRFAARRLARHKGLSAAEFRNDPASLVTSRAELGRFFAYMAAHASRQRNAAWAILYYCQAAKADPRYLTLEGIEPDQDEQFLPDLKTIRLATLLFFVDEVAKPARVVPSRWPPDLQPVPSDQEGPRP